MESFMLYSVILLWVTQAFILFILFLLFRQFGEVYLKSGESISRDGIPIGEMLPDFEGISFKTNHFLEKKKLIHRTTLMAFISPECKPCRELLEDWNGATEFYQEQVEFVLIILGNKDRAHKLLKNQIIHGEIVLDDEKEITNLLQVRITPFCFVIDKTGVVRAKGLCGGREHIDQLLSETKDSFNRETFITK